MSLIITQRPTWNVIGERLTFQGSFSSAGIAAFTTNTHGFAYGGTERVYIECDVPEYSGYFRPTSTGSGTTFRIQRISESIDVPFVRNVSYAKIYKLDTTQSSSWNQVGNPVLYKATRKDYNITAVANSAGALQITVNTNLTTLTTAQGGPVVVGGTLWVSTDNGTYNAAYTVVSVTNAANSVVVFSAGTYVSAATTGYINLIQRLNYKVQVGVYTPSLLGTIQVSPNTKGELIIDISRILWSELKPDILDDLVYNNLGADQYAWGEFGIKHKETWIGSAETEVDDTANEYFSLYGANQIGDYNGGLADYTLQKAGTEILTNGGFTGSLTGWSNFLSGNDWLYNANTARVSLAGATKALTQLSLTFTQGKLYIITVNYELGTGPVSLYFALSNGTTRQETLISDTAVSTNTRAFFIRANNNYDRIEIYGSATDYMFVNTISSINTDGASKFLTLFDEPKIWRGYPFTLSAIWGSAAGSSVFRNVFYVGDSVRTTQDGDTTDKSNQLTRLILDNVGTGIDDTDTHVMVFGFSVANGIISEVKDIYIENPCDNPVYLMWRNSKGGDACWMFQINQEYSFVYDDGVKKKRYVLFADNLTLNQWEGINDLNRPSEIYQTNIIELSTSVKGTSGQIGTLAQIVDTGGNRTNVVVIPTEQTTNTKQVKHTINITIELPQIQLT